MLFIVISCWAQEFTFTTSDSVDLYVKVSGEGIPCLYIHGGPGSGSYWMEQFSGDVLEENFKMIYLDLRGVGRSTSPENRNYGMDRMVKDFEEIRKHLGIEKWLILGHSFSGTMLTGYANRFPENLLGMLMFNCTLDIKESINESWIPYACEILDIPYSGYFDDPEKSLHMKLDSLFTLLNQNQLGWKMAFSSRESEEIMNATYNDIPNWNGDFSGIGLSHEDYSINFKPYTSEIELPVLFFYGKYDYSIGPTHYQGVNFPNMLLWESEVGHIPFLENKSDVKKAIEAYLEKYKLYTRIWLVLL